jgi:hypothetical protein
MLAQFRDVLAVMILDQQLAKLREQFLRETLEGRVPGEDFWKVGEAQIFERIKSTYYNTQVQQFIQPTAADSSDAVDFAHRTQRLSEHAVLATHRILASLPFVGQPEQRT